MAALNRAAAGTIAGGVVGGLVDLSIPEYEAKAYEDAIKKGYLVADTFIPLKHSGSTAPCYTTKHFPLYGQPAGFSQSIDY
jgi:hypothetical protein